jgi:Aspartyl protease
MSYNVEVEHRPMTAKISIAVILAVLLLPFPNTHSGTGASNSGDAALQAHASPEDRHVIPFEFYTNLIFLSVRVNGSQPYSFLLDTGANGSFVSETLADSLDLKTNEASGTYAPGVGGQMIHWGSAKNVTFSLNGLSYLGQLLKTEQQSRRHWGLCPSLSRNSAFHRPSLQLDSEH